MSKEIKVFKNESLDLKVRAIQNEDGSISISAYDTAVGFGWCRTAQSGNVSIRWERVNKFIQEIGSYPLVGIDDFIPESLFYLLGMKANNDKAKEFQQWLAVEVIPDIRKHGMYATEDTIDTMLNNPDFAIRLLTEYKEEKEQRKKLEAENKVLKPKADYTDLVLQNKSLMTITQIAKDYGMSGQGLNKLLNELGIQYKQSGQWLLYRKYDGNGYTNSSTYVINKGIPEMEKVIVNTKWTQKGRLFIYETLKEIGIFPVIEQIQDELAN